MIMCRRELSNMGRSLLDLKVMRLYVGAGSKLKPHDFHHQIYAFQTTAAYQ